MLVSKLALSKAFRGKPSVNQYNSGCNAGCRPRRMRGQTFVLVMLTLWVLAAPGGAARGASGSKAEVWRFDRLERIGGHPTKVLGHPDVIPTPYGKAVEFHGVDDALFVDAHPLAGAETWTWEVIFRPDQDGNPEQRFFHLSVTDPTTGKDTDDRMLFEIRIRDGQWCLDSFAKGGPGAKALLNCNKKYPLDQWYRVTAVYDGKTLKNYVGNELQGEGEVSLLPQKAGHASIGVRINLKDYFKGAVLEARFTPRALPEAEFLKMPPRRK
jgi:Concanavalin A-like lectin/glucanases superfamily